MQNCYTACKVPEPLTEQDERLTAKHIKSLSFLQDLGKENKDLKAKLKALQEKVAECPEIHSIAAQSQCKLQETKDKMTSLTDDIVRKLLEKHQAELIRPKTNTRQVMAALVNLVNQAKLMQQAEERLDNEKRWQLEKEKYGAEIERLLQRNASLQAHISSTHEKDGRVPELQAKLDGLNEDVRTVKEENLQLEQAKQNQLREIEHLNSVKERNDHLIEELQEANQKNKEFEFRVARLERDLDDRGYKEQEDCMNTLKSKLTLLHKERSTWGDKQSSYLTEVQELKEEIAKLRKALVDSERMRGDLHKQIETLMEELDALRQKSAFDRTGQVFKDFVQLKRDVAYLREENEDLKGRMRPRSGLLPTLKANGATASSVQHTGKSERKIRECTSLSMLARK